MPQSRFDSGGAGGTVTLTCDGEAVALDLDTVTALGIVVAEVVTNSYDHAFPGGTGSIRVSVRHEQRRGHALRP